MFSRSVIEDSRSITDTSRVFRMMTVSGATIWSPNYYDSRVTIYNRNVFIVQATGYDITYYWF
jgi:hypothetical protein